MVGNPNRRRTGFAYCQRQVTAGHRPIACTSVCRYRKAIQAQYNMMELRTQVHGQPLRTFYAFDPRRKAILLIGGSKVGDGRFYDRMIPLADKLMDEHLQEIEKEDKR